MVSPLGPLISNSTTRLKIKRIKVITMRTSRIYLFNAWALLGPLINSNNKINRTSVIQHSDSTA